MSSPLPHPTRTRPSWWPQWLSASSTAPGIQWLDWEEESAVTLRDGSEGHPSVSQRVTSYPT